MNSVIFLKVFQKPHISNYFRGDTFRKKIFSAKLKLNYQLKNLKTDN